MADVLRDAAAKLNALKESVGKQKDSGGKSEAVVKALTERHEREKAATAAEFDAFRKRAAAREKEMQSDFNERLTTVKVRYRLRVSWRACARVVLAARTRPEAGVSLRITC